MNKLLLERMQVLSGVEVKRPLSLREELEDWEPDNPQLLKLVHLHNEVDMDMDAYTRLGIKGPLATSRLFGKVEFFVKKVKDFINSEDFKENIVPDDAKIVINLDNDRKKVLMAKKLFDEYLGLADKWLNKANKESNLMAKFGKLNSSYSNAHLALQVIKAYLK